MSGSRLGRGRGGRLAVYGGCGVVVILLVFLYRAATSEMARLRELHVQCAHQQEALAAQLQVIFEYKLRLEKSLAEEKSSNAAVKQELQQRATREKSLRDKDSIEAMQRFNSLQQTYKLLQTEHQDLQEECKKREKQAFEDTNRLEATLRELRSRIKQAREDKEKALEHLKTKFLELDTAKTRLEEKYKDVLKNLGDTDSTIEHLKKEVFQLKRELEQEKIPIPPSGRVFIQQKFSKKASSTGPSAAGPQSSQQTDQQMKPGAAAKDEQLVEPSQQQQVSRPSNDDKSPQPLHAPRNHYAIGDPLKSNEQRMNEETNEFNDVRFAQKNGNIVPVGPNELKEGELRDSLPLPYDLQEKRRKNPEDPPAAENAQIESDRAAGKDENVDEEQMRQVLPPPNQNNERIDKKSSSNSPGNEEAPFKENIDSLARPVEKIATVTSRQPSKKEEERLDKVQNSEDEIARDVLNQLMNADLIDP